MYKIGEFIYPWGGGHHSRMMRFDRALELQLQANGNKDDSKDGGAIIHYSSRGHIHRKLSERFAGRADRHVHEILMPVPIDGEMGPSLSKSLANVVLPVEGNPPIISQIAGYLRQERALYNREMFDLAVSDGDMGANILARNRGIPCIFITNQFRPRLYRTRSYLYPALVFVSRQIAKAAKILVADSPPPHTICEYNLNFTDDVMEKVEYVGHFADEPGAAADAMYRGGGGGGGSGGDETEKSRAGPGSDLEDLLGAAGTGGFGYWMRTGSKSTNDGTGKRYEQVFAQDEMRVERRLVSHARSDPGIDSVLGADGRRYTVAEAADRNVDWIQIDVGFLSEHDKDAVLEACDYAVVNGSHTVMGEIMGGKARPIIGVPIYDEHTNNIRWADDHGLGVMAKSTRQIISAISAIRRDASGYADRLAEFSRGFDGGGAQNAARIAAEMLAKGDEG